ncbi:hypothetical protein MIR68_007007 [Amoeboaphelidium protococcarum]|nr:hypothetical protein MIR68_007007 [Amoeboaphelidium protococcarum]
MDWHALVLILMLLWAYVANAGTAVFSEEMKMSIFTTLTPHYQSQVKNHANICYYADHHPTFENLHEQIAFRYETVQLLSSGTYGQVYRAIDHCTVQWVALKIFRNPRKDKSKREPQFYLTDGQNEYKFASSLAVRSSSHCVPAFDNYWFEDFYAITYPLFSTDLVTYNRQFLSRMSCDDTFRITQSVTRQILDCLVSLHASGIVHNDLKPQNILITGPIDNPTVGVTDFGLSCTEDQCDWHRVTPWYEAPEIIQSGRGNDRSDIWSLGMIVAELYRSKPVFSFVLPDKFQLLADAFMTDHSITLESILNRQIDDQELLDFAQQNNLRPQALYNYLSRPLKKAMYRQKSDQCRDAPFDDLLSFVQECLEFNHYFRQSAVELSMHPFLLPDSPLQNNQNLHYVDGQMIQNSEQQ